MPDHGGAQKWCTQTVHKQRSEASKKPSVRSVSDLLRLIGRAIIKKLVDIPRSAAIEEPQLRIVHTFGFARQLFDPVEGDLLGGYK
jgi:hypothetical protein